jgi:hypothetical protein
MQKRSRRHNRNDAECWVKKTLKRGEMTIPPMTDSHVQAYVDCRSPLHTSGSRCQVDFRSAILQTWHPCQHGRSNSYDRIAMMHAAVIIRLTYYGHPDAYQLSFFECNHSSSSSRTHSLSTAVEDDDNDLTQLSRSKHE